MSKGKTRLAELIRSALPSDSKYWKRGGQHYHGSRPYVVSSDSDCLHVNFDDFTWYDHHPTMMRGGGFANLAKLLGIDWDGGYTPVLPVDNPTSLREYEMLKGLPKGFLSEKGWREGKHQNRTCLFIPTTLPDDIEQVRFLDEKKPKYTWSKSLKYKDELGNEKTRYLPIYGLRDAAEIARKNNLPFLIQTNGAISVEVAQYWGLPAFAILGGEGNTTKRHVDTVLNFTELPILVIFDADKAGVTATEVVSEMYGDKGIAIDLPAEFGTGFDLADFCTLFTDTSLEAIKNFASQAYDMQPARTLRDAGERVLARIAGERERKGRIIPMPFESLRKIGGGAAFMLPGLITGIAGASGAGKTMMWQSMVDTLTRQTRRWGVLVDAREFTTEDDFVRHVSRGTDVKMDEVYAHEVAQQIEIERQAGWYIEEDEREIGQFLTEDKFEQLRQFAQSTRHYAGHLEYADEYDYIEDTLSYMIRKTYELRAAGTSLDLWIFDYLTLYKLKPETQRGSGDHLYNVILAEIKRAARKANVHAIVMLQPNKEPSADQKHYNKMLTAEDIAYVHENHFNLIISINPMYGSRAFWSSTSNRWVVSKDTDGTVKRGRARLRDGTYAGVIKCIKNTNGRNDWEIAVRADYERLRWLDETWVYSDLCVQLNEGVTKKNQKRKTKR